jgi:hypothetical protein
MLIFAHRRRPGRLAIAAALCLAMPGAALAQEYPAAPVASGENEARPPTAATVPTAPASKEAGTTAQPSAQPEQPNGLAAMGRSLVGKTIYGRDGEQIAEIDNLVRTNDEIQAVLVDVGGFLGFGAKTVAIALTDLELRGDRIVAPKMTEKDLDAMPAYRGPR